MSHVVDAPRIFYLHLERDGKETIARFVFHGRDEQWGHSRASWRLVCAEELKAKGYTCHGEATEAEYCRYTADRRFKYGA